MCKKRDAVRVLYESTVYLANRDGKVPEMEALIERALDHGYFLNIDRKCLEAVLNDQFSKVMKSVAEEFVKN